MDTNNHTGYAQVVEEVQNGSVVRQYTFGHDLISQRQEIAGNWTVHFYGYDGHGSTRYLTDANGTVTDTYDYDAFGNLIGQTGNTPNLYRYCGEQFDPDLGLYFLRARYLDVQSGRFWTQDSWEGDGEFPLSFNKYLYANTNPVNYSDPSGEFSIIEGIGFSVVALPLAGMGSIQIANQHQGRRTPLSRADSRTYENLRSQALRILKKRECRSYLTNALTPFLDVNNNRYPGGTVEGLEQTVRDHPVYDGTRSTNLAVEAGITRRAAVEKEPPSVSMVLLGQTVQTVFRRRGSAAMAARFNGVQKAIYVDMTQMDSVTIIHESLHLYLEEIDHTIAFRLGATIDSDDQGNVFDTDGINQALRKNGCR